MSASEPAKETFSLRFDRPDGGGSRLSIAGDGVSLAPDGGPSEARAFGDVPVAHLVAPEVIARFAGCSNVVFADHRRAEVQDLDRDWRERTGPPP